MQKFPYYYIMELSVIIIMNIVSQLLLIVTIYYFPSINIPVTHLHWLDLGVLFVIYGLSYTSVDESNLIITYLLLSAVLSLISIITINANYEIAMITGAFATDISFFYLQTLKQKWKMKMFARLHKCKQPYLPFKLNI